MATILPTNHVRAEFHTPNHGTYSECFASWRDVRDEFDALPYRSPADFALISWCHNGQEFGRLSRDGVATIYAPIPR